MTFSATAFKVLIASPSDLSEERAIISRVLHDWNVLHAEERKVILMPVMWETHSAPSMDGEAQDVINTQFAHECDMVIGAFWTRLGSPTSKAESGTVEEIQWFIKNKKPVMLYFSNRPVPPKNIVTQQFTKLAAFKEDMQTRGLYGEFSSKDELANKLSAQVTLIIQKLNLSPTVDSKAVIKELERSKPALMSESNKADLKITFNTEKSFLVVGNTLAIKAKIQEIGGKWQVKSDGRKGWMFSNRRLDEVADLLGLPAIIEPA